MSRAPSEFVFRPIGVIHTPHKHTDGVPIQGIFAPEAQGQIEVFPEFEEGLTDIEGFSHLIALYVFHRSRDFELMVKPYMDENLHGVFAVRAPKRPNPLGISIVRLIARQGCILQIAEADMLDETPLLDIKPYVPQFDAREDVRAGWMERVFRAKDFRKISDDRF